MSASSHKPNNNFLSDLTDGREKGDWKSRYEPEAHDEIKKEKNYLLILLLGSFGLLTFFTLFYKGCLFELSCDLSSVKPYIFGAIGGLIGGVIFSMKWLVHSVAKNTWNLDRQLWRYFTPLLSGTIAFLIIVLMHAAIFNSNLGDSYSSYKSLGIGFLSGYFSDNAIGKLTEIAQVLFGSTASKGK